jgi:hypothetical protein
MTMIRESQWRFIQTFPASGGTDMGLSGKHNPCHIGKRMDADSVPAASLTVGDRNTAFDDRT